MNGLVGVLLKVGTHTILALRTSRISNLIPPQSFSFTFYSSQVGGLIVVSVVNSETEN